jgi:hypothetical protein
MAPVKTEWFVMADAVPGLTSYAYIWNQLAIGNGQ